MREELINDLISVIKIMEENWKYHPDNPNQEDIIAEYTQLEKIRGDIENELKVLD